MSYISEMARKEREAQEAKKVSAAPAVTVSKQTDTPGKSYIQQMAEKERASAAVKSEPAKEPAYSAPIQSSLFDDQVFNGAVAKLQRDARRVNSWDLPAAQSPAKTRTEAYQNVIDSLASYDENALNQAAVQYAREYAAARIGKRQEQAPVSSETAYRELSKTLSSPYSEQSINAAAGEYQSGLAREQREADQAEKDAARRSRMEQYSSMQSRPDFEDGSVYTSSYRQGMSDAEWKYNYINGNQQAITRHDDGPYTDWRYLKQMDDDEVATYNYIYNTQGEEASEQYLQDITGDLNARSRESTEKYWSGIAEEHPVASSAFSVIAKPLNAAALPGQIVDYLQDGSIDQNAPYNTGVHAVNAIRGTVAKKIEEDLGEKWGPVGSWGYQLGMSMADSALNMLPVIATGGTSVATEKMMLGLMGSGAAADTVISMKDQGYDDNRVMTLGIVAGLAEYVTERIGMDSAMEIITRGVSEETFKKRIIKNLIQQTGSEGLEEGLSDIINWTADSIYSAMTGDPTEFQRMVQEYKRQGKTDGEAMGLAVADRWKEFGMDVAGGALSGLFMGAGGTALNYGGNVLSQVNTVRNTPGAVQGLVESGLESAPESRAYTIAQQNQQRIDAGRELSALDILRQGRANNQAIESEEFADAVWDEAVKGIRDRDLNIDGEALASQSDARNEVGRVIYPSRENAAQNGAQRPSAVESNNRSFDPNRAAEAENQAVRITDGSNVMNTATNLDATSRSLASMAMKLGKAGGTNLIQSYDGVRDVNQYMEDFTKVYNAARNNEEIPQTRLNAVQEFAARTAGINDANAEVGNELQVRQGGERNDRQNTGGQVRGVAEAAGGNRGGNESGYVSTRRADRAAASLKAGEKVSVASLGIAGGSTTASIRIVENGSDTEYTKLARETARRNGLRLTLFVGGDLEIDGQTGIRGAIVGDRVFVRADDPDFNADQLMRHEEGHYLIRTGQIDFDSVLRKMSLLDQDATVAVVKNYAEAYEGSGMTADEIYEEIICDALGDMNIFEEYAELKPSHGEYISTLKDQAGSRSNQARAPTDAGIKFSSRSDVLKLDNVDWMDNNSRIRTQLSKHAADINTMTPVAEVEYVHDPQESLVEIMMNTLPDIGGGKIKRDSVEFEFDRQGAQSINAHATGAELRASAMAAPYVAKYGKLIAGQKNHEGRGFATLTYAAPVVINGSTVNVGLAVQFTNSGRPRAVNVEVQDGSVFRINKTSRGTSSRVGRYNQGTALDTRDASINRIASTKETVKSLSEVLGGIPDTGEGLELKKSLRPTDPQEKKTIDWLNSQETQKVYRAMQVIDGKLYPPMAARVKDSSGKKSLVEASEIGMWDQAVERPDLIKNGNKFELDKANGSSIQAAYNPYFHTSRSMLNDQFSSAYKRDNIVIVECEIPVSELSSGYKAQYAKDSVGEMKWHSGPVSSKLTGEKARRVILSRWVKPVRIVPNAEVAQHVKSLLDGTDISIPYNTVTPSLRAELEKIGVPVTGDHGSQRKFSMRAPTQDTAGRSLTKEQQDYFKDSKVRDENGSLMVMYHGTPNAGFTVFRSGAYFTQDRWYAEGYQKPSASAISRGKTADNPGVYDVYLDIKKPFDTRLPEVRKIWDEEFYRQWGTGTPLQESGLPDWTDGLDLQEFIEENGYDFDGLILDEGGFPDKDGNIVSRGLSYVTFDPDQVKNVNNKKPTKDPDIRFSMKAPIEQTDRLIAWHNMTESALDSALDLGGLAMPSFAVKTADSVHDTYGPISILAYRESVEPTKSGSQMIFGGDAWTPVFPEIGYKIADNAIDYEERIGRTLKKAGLQNSEYFNDWDPGNIQHALERTGGDFVAAYKNNTALQYAYAAEQNVAPELKRIPRRFSQHADNETLDRLYKAYTENYGEDQDHQMEFEPELRKIMHEYAATRFNQKLADKLYPLDEELGYGEVNRILYDAFKYGRASDKTQVDSKAMEESLRQLYSDPEIERKFENWLRQMGRELVVKKGIRNSKDLFTPSGNRRSFDQLYLDYSLENIVKAMKAQPKQGRTMFLSGAAAVKGAALKSYRNMEDVRSDRSRLKPRDAEGIDEAYKAFQAHVRRVAEVVNPHDTFNGADDLAEILSVAKTKDAIYRYLNKNFSEYIDVTEDLAQEIYEIGQEANELPMEYFEAKLYREFPFDEAAAVIVPDTTSQDLIQRLEEAGAKVETYKAGDNEDRLKVANGVRGAKFSRRVPASDVKNGVDISGVTVNDVTERLNVSESDATPAVEAINSFDGVQIEMDLAGLLKKKDIQTAFDAFKRDLIYDGGVSFVGRTFRNASELAAAANIFRDPRFETVRYIFTDAEGKVVMNTGVSSQIPNCSPIFTKPQMLPDIFNKAQDLGARNVYMMHNHPSGDPTPSGADFGTAKYLEEFAAQGHIKMRECIIINHKKGTLFRGDGTVDRFDYSAGEADPLLNVGDTIRGPKDMLKIAESINSESDDVVFIYSNAKGSVTGIQKVAGRYFTGSDGSGQFGKLQKYLHDNGLSFGANSIFAYTKNPSEGLMSVLEGAYMQGFLRDVTGSGEPSLHEQGVFSRGSSDNEYMGQKHRAESRFSRRASNDSIEQLRQSNDELRNTVAQLNKELKAETARANKAESQLKRTEKPTARAEDIRKLARQYTTGTDADINEAAAKMQALADKIIQGGSEGVLVYDELMDDAMDIVRPIVDGTKELMNGQELETINGIRKYFRDGKFHFDNMARYNESASNIAKAAGKGQTRGEITDYEDLRRRNFGRFTLTKDVNARAIDDAWKEAQEMFGTEYFPEDINSIPDMILHISELLDTLGPVYANPYSYDMAEAKQWMANELLNDLIGESVRQTAPTYADRMHQKLERQAYQAREKMNEALAKEREKRDEIVKAVKDHYKEIAAAKRERKLESAERTKLLNIAKRLANKKLPAANRALINQYIGDLDLTAKSITGKSIKKLSELRDWYDERKASDPDFISDPNIEKAIARLGQHHISELTIGEVRELTDVLLNIENELRTERELIDSQVRHDTYMAGLQTIQDILNSRGVSKGDKLDNLFIGNTLSPLRALHRMTGYNDNSPLYKLTQELSAGQRKTFDFQMRARKNFESWANNKKFTDAVSGKNARFIWITGHTADGDVKVRITPAMRMSLYLHSLNDQNLRHIQGGGLTIPDEALYKAGEIAEAYARGITVKLNPSEVRAIAAGMTPEERAFANAARKYFNGMSQEAINEVSEKLKGYSLAQVEEYFPITTDPNYSKRDFESLKFDGTIEGMGFLKERVNASNPIMLQDMNEVLNRSIDNTSRYVGLAIPVRNFNKVWGVTSGSFNEDGTRNNFEGSVQKAMGQKYGTAGKQYIENLMKDLQSGKTASEDWGKLMNRLRSNYAKAVLTLNASVAMKQAASYPTAGAVLGGKALARAMADFGKVDLDLIARYTPLQWYRAQGFSTQELGDMARNNKQLPRILNWVQGMDLITTRKLWKASEYYVRDNFKDLERGTDAYYRKVAEIYNRVIEETQPNYTTMQRPGILRTDNTLLQSILMFKTQPFQNFNVVYDAYGNLIAKQAAYRNTGSEAAKAEFVQAKKAAWDATWSQVAQLAIFAGMTFLWNMFRGKRKNYEDEEGELTTDSILKKIGKDMLGSAASGIPGGAELWEMASSFLFGDHYYGIDSVTASALADTMSSMLDVANEWRDLTEALRTGDEIDWNKERFKIEKMVNTISKTAGVPVENVMNLFKAFFMYGAETVQGKYLGEYAYLKLTVNPASYPGDYYDLLYKARQKDPEAYSQIYNDMLNGDFFTTDGSEYFTEKKIKSNMEKRMKEDGDESKYMSPGMEKAYSQGVSAMQRSDLWNDADARQRQAAEDLLNKNYSDAEKLDEKLSGARQHGMSESDFALYLLALSMYDEPNKSGNYGSYTGEEKLAAADALNLDAALAEYLKSLSY